jgi:hypothetical protein
VFLQPVKDAPKVKTLGALADYLKANPDKVMVGAVAGDDGKRLDRVKSKIQFSHVQHFEDKEREDELLPATTPITVNGDTVTLPYVPQQYADSEENFKLLAVVPEVWKGVVKTPPPVTPHPAALDGDGPEQPWRNGPTFVGEL